MKNEKITLYVATYEGLCNNVCDRGVSRADMLWTDFEGVSGSWQALVPSRESAERIAELTADQLESLIPWDGDAFGDGAIGTVRRPLSRANLIVGSCYTYMGPFRELGLPTATESGLDYTWSVVNDNADGLMLCVFEDDKIIYAHHGYEHTPGRLTANIVALHLGADPRDWGGCEDDIEDLWSYVCAHEECVVIVDQDGPVAYDKMGRNGQLEFYPNGDPAEDGAVDNIFGMNKEMTPEKKIALAHVVRTLAVPHGTFVDAGLAPAWMDALRRPLSILGVTAVVYQETLETVWGQRGHGPSVSIQLRLYFGGSVCVRSPMCRRTEEAWPALLLSLQEWSHDVLADGLHTPDASHGG